MNVKAWLQYAMERIPVVEYLLLINGVLSVGFSNWSLSAYFLGLTLLLLFFSCLRLMDDIKDYDKDIVANKDRPLPRGLVQMDEAKKMVMFIWMGMVIVSLLTAFLWSAVLGITYFATTVYLYLMFKEFYINEFLEKKPILYGITHQVILIPLVLSAYFCFYEEGVEPKILGHAVVVLAGFFQYEILRKMNPKADKILGYYLTHYGFKKVVFFVVCLMVLGLVSSYYSGAFFLILSMYVFVGAGLYLVSKDEEKFKLVETFATVSLFMHLISFFIAGLL